MDLCSDAHRDMEILIINRNYSKLRRLSLCSKIRPLLYTTQPNLSTKGLELSYFFLLLASPAELIYKKLLTVCAATVCDAEPC